MKYANPLNIDYIEYQTSKGAGSVYEDHTAAGAGRDYREEIKIYRNIMSRTVAGGGRAVHCCLQKYWDARHNCSAYVIGENNEIMHSSDDGEPSGTAGRPMLSGLTGQDVHNVAVVVTRYFGGVLLGTGGLVRAYQGAVSEALLHAEIRQQLLMQELMLTAEYTDVGKIQYLLSQAGFRTADTEYGAKVLFHVLVPAGEEDAAIKLLTEKTNGKTEITKGELRNETCE